MSGNNIGVAGGHFRQEAQNIVCNCCKMGCNFAVDIFHSSGVKFRDSVVQGSFGSAVRVQEAYDPGCGKPGLPPVSKSWGILPGLARQPVFITNVTLHHHSNQSFFNLRGFWTVTASNVILSRNHIYGPFMYSIDLDSSSSGNLVTNNYMEGCIWEGVFTECESYQTIDIYGIVLTSAPALMRHCAALMNRPCCAQYYYKQHNHRPCRQQCSHSLER